MTATSSKTLCWGCPRVMMSTAYTSPPCSSTLSGTLGEPTTLASAPGLLLGYPPGCLLLSLSATIILSASHSYYYHQGQWAGLPLYIFPTAKYNVGTNTFSPTYFAVWAHCAHYCPQDRASSRHLLMPVCCMCDVRSVLQLHEPARPPSSSRTPRRLSIPLQLSTPWL